MNTKQKWFTWLVTMAFLVCLPLSASAGEKMMKNQGPMNTSGKTMASTKAVQLRNSAEQTVMKSTQVFKNEISNVEQTIPPSIVSHAAGIAIFPGLIKAAFVAGGSYGHGVVLARQQDGNWSPPLFVTMSGGSLGAQIGVQSTDLVLVFKDRSALDRLAGDHSFTLGADASVSAGQVGASETASANNAQVLAYKYNSGLFAGASLDGSVMNIDKKPTIAYYQMKPASESARGYYGSDAGLYNRVIGVSGMSAPKLAMVPESANTLRLAIVDFASRATKSTE